MAEDKFLPEYTVTDNPYGRMTFGPLGPEDKNDGSALTVSLKGGHYRHYNENGSQLERVPGSSHEVCGIVAPVSEKSDDEKEVVSKSLWVCKEVCLCQFNTKQIITFNRGE